MLRLRLGSAGCFRAAGSPCVMWECTQSKKEWLQKKTAASPHGTKGAMSDRRRERLLVNQPWMQAPFGKGAMARGSPSPSPGGEEEED